MHLSLGGRREMNTVWRALIVSAALYDAIAGTMEAVSLASIDSAKSAVNLAIGLAVYFGAIGSPASATRWRPAWSPTSPA